MASFAEATPQGPGEFDDVEAHISGRPIRVFAQGEHHIILHPGNFPELLDAYQLNRNGEGSDHFATETYQRYLLSDSNGIASTQALDKLTSDEANGQTLTRAIGHKDKQERAYHYAKLVDEAATHLPAELDAGILRDPCLAQEAA